MRRLSVLVVLISITGLTVPAVRAETPPTPSSPPTPPGPPAPAPPTPPSSPPARPWTPEVPAPPAPPRPTLESPAPHLDEKGGAEAPIANHNPAPPPPTNVIWWDIGYRYPGSYSTARLSALIGRAQRAMASRAQERSLGAPFIVGGYVRFWDSWGEVRRADSGLRPHLGQDVFCAYGAPVRAAETGTLEYGQDATGGLVARLHRGNGSYWYYAHLSRFEPTRSSGDRVRPGDVIGYCGTSGNAAGTEPHVHFGFFVNHTAQNPMGALIEWLQVAERRAEILLQELRRRKPQPKPPDPIKVPLVAPLAAVPGPRCYSPLQKEPFDLALLLSGVA